MIATDEFSDTAEYEVEEIEVDHINEWENEDREIDEDGFEWATSEGDFSVVEDDGDEVERIP